MLIVSTVLLVGCGGGSTSKDGGENPSNSNVDLTYKGKTKKVKLTENNTKYFIDLINASYSKSVFPVPTQKLQKSQVLQQKSFKLSSTMLSSRKVIDKDSRNGVVSGTLSILVEETGKYTGKITLTYKNFSDVKGLVANGKVIQYITVNKNEVTTKNKIDYQLFNVELEKENITIDGTVSVSLVATGTVIVENYVVKNNKTSEMIKYDNYKTLLTKQEQIVSYQGKIYDSNYGYVEVSTLTPLAYNEDGTRKPEGELKLEGESSSVNVKYAYDNRIRVEIDDNKDGVIDDVQVYREGEYETELPNAAPVVNITFPQSIFTDTDMLEVKVNVYDPDLDGFSVSYEWQINSEVKGNELILDNTLFKKHDILKFIVAATDDRVGDVKSSTQSKEQEVLNSAPKIVLELDKTTVEVGDKIIVDASKSFDVDGDNFTYEWNTQNRQYTIHDTSYDINQTYLDINDSNKSKILFLGEVVNYYYVDYSVKPYGIQVTLNDGDTNGTSKLKSEDIIVNVMDVFDRELIILENKNIFTSGISAMDIADVNNDGLKDIILITDTSDEYEDNGKLIILLQDNTNKFTVQKKIVLGNISPYTYNSISVSDLNSDGLPDIAYTSPTMKGFNVYYQDRDGDFLEEKEYFTKSFPHVPFPTEPDMIEYISNSVNYLRSVDMNKDGKKDMVTIGSNSMTSGSTGINIFLQNDINLSDSKMLALDNRTIEHDGQYESTDSHKIGKIHIQDVDGDSKQDIVVSNYIEYQEDNGSYSETVYEDIDSITFIDFNETKKMMIGLNTFDNHMIIYKNNFSREYIKGKTMRILVPNPNQSVGLSIRNTQKSEIIIGHDAWPYFTMFIQKGINQEFYGDQVFKLSGSDSIGYSNAKDSLMKEDINNDGKQDIILLGNKGFEIFYTK